MNISVEYGIESRETPVPEGFTVVETYHPHSCPWDCYGRQFVRETQTVLKNAGIESVECSIRQTILHPHGSGPGGRVRLGDNMMPGAYRVAVKSDDMAKALQALEAHKTAIHDWLHNGGKMPEACRA